jgi:hypothetical protein
VYVMVNKRAFKEQQSTAWTKAFQLRARLRSLSAVQAL